MILDGNKYETLTDIVEGCTHHNRQAQERLYNLYAPRMLALCRRYVGERETALDLMHDGFIRVFTNIQQHDENGNFEAWLRRIFVNVALEYLRKNNALRNSCEANDTLLLLDNGDETIFEKMSCDEIMHLIDALPMGFRTVFNLYAIEGYNHAEIAEQLGISESTSRSQFMRARATLQKELKRIYSYNIEKQ